MNKKTLWLALAAVALAAATGWFAYTRYNLFKMQALDQRKVDTSVFIRKQAAKLTAADFSSAKPGQSQKIFDNLWASVQSPDYVRIKAWDTDYKIVYSNLPELIGQRFADNNEVKQALAGETPLLLEDSEDLKAEHFSEREYAELTEAYIPLMDKEKVFGVIEVYQQTAALSEAAKAKTTKTVLPVAVVVLAVWAGIALAVRRV